jgi:SEC-C motif domain protein
MKKKPVFTFSSEDINDLSLLCSYNMTSDDNNALQMNVDGTQYTWIDSYCKNPTCDCSIVLIDIFILEKKEIFTSFFYDYSSRKITEELMPVPKFFIDDLGEDEELNQSFATRNQIVREAFAECLLKRNALKRQQQFQPKIGRNDPCSCGSGKKYKKCCGI